MKCAKCTGGIVVWYRKDMQAVIDYYPRVKRVFASSVTPQNLRESLEEAATCHANGCHRAAAIMLRRSLELLCNLQGANGHTLHAKLANLRDVGKLPDNIWGVMDQLRIVGNDAAHWQERDFQVDRETVEAAFDATMLLMAVFYEATAILERLARLRRT
jgi:hypothetical protein